MDIRKISAQSQNYPFLLKQITDFPSEIYCVGDISLLQKRCITIVGTRDITRYGRNILQNFLQKDLLPYNISFVSGLAIGIDAEVHRRCLEQGLSTIAVVAGGLDMGFPRANLELYQEIAKKGLVIAEYPVGTKIERYMFAKRNRIMAGLSDTTVVVESKMKSGSLLTAQLALDCNREVYAIPGDIYRKTSEGCNFLIQEGSQSLINREEFLEIFENTQGRFFI